MTTELQLDRATIVDQNFIRRVRQGDFPVPSGAATLQSCGLAANPALAVEIFYSQLESRQLDLIARELRKNNQGFYTIGSSGHEANAAIAAALLQQDMAFLHYRSCAFMLQRARMIMGEPRLLDHLLALTASNRDPISGGRHKVFGNVLLNVPPQTSTIASHLPKAVGAAFSIALVKNKANSLAYSAEAAPKLRDNSIILCSFGDASLNHSTAQGAINTAQLLCSRRLPLPIIFVCEDNGIGISVITDPHWIENNIKQRQNITYLPCDGLNIFDVYATAVKAAAIARRTRQPVFLHMKTVRLLGHAGSDIEFHYRSLAEIEAIEAQDPLLHSARLLIEHGLITAEQIIEKYSAILARIHNLLPTATRAPKLTSKAEIMASIVPPALARQLPEIPEQINKDSKIGKNCTLAQSINWALHDLMAQYGQIIVFGEDVGKKGGVYRVTADLQQHYGAQRVIDSVLDEQTILGMAIGFAHNGLLPIPEIQFLAYIHNAIDQIRGEAATISFFSNGQFTNPMVLRLPGLAYQKGFGGHFHNDNALAFLREIPGVIIACPSNALDAPALLRSCVALAYQQQRVVVFLEPIALYFTRDLLEIGDNKWLYPYSTPTKLLPYGKISVSGESTDLVIISYGNGYWLACQAAAKVLAEHGINLKLIDLRWLAPLPVDELLHAVSGVVNVLIVDEGRRTGSISETLFTLFMERLTPLPNIQRITGEDCFIPLGEAWQYILPSVADIVAMVRYCLQK